MKKKRHIAWAIICGGEIWGRGSQHKIYPTKKCAIESLGSYDPKLNNPPLTFQKILLTPIGKE